MSQDLLKTIRILENTAIGNCRKRIEEARKSPKKKAKLDTSEDMLNTGRTCHGVTSVLKRKYGL